MFIKAIKTRIVRPPKDDLFEVIQHSLKSLREKTILVITSKIVSIGQGRCVPMDHYPDRDVLVKEEADFWLPRNMVPGAWCMHTLKNNLLIPSAGIDESNADGHYILWPKNPKRVARELWLRLRRKYKVKDLGIIISDSHSIPLRRGVSGISLAHYGFAPLKDYRETPDIFGRLLKVSQANIPDGLAAAAVLLMGEGCEQTPIAMIEDIPWVRFVAKPVKSQKPFSSFEVGPSEDLYKPLFSSVRWRRGRGRSHI